MSTASMLRLLALSAIWGSSFLFMRIGAPLLGPVMLIALRVALAALFLALVHVMRQQPLGLRGHARHFLVLGLINSALPFLLFATAARTLSASLMAILNATAPIWGAIVASLWSRTLPRPAALLGLALGIVGVAILVRFDPSSVREGAPRAILLGLAASLCYGVSTTYARSAPRIDAFANAHGSMWAATLWIAPAVPFFVHPAPLSPTLVIAVLALGILCSGVAYLLYFRLIADLGPTSALTVTFLVPVFGILWGHVFLGEPVGWDTLAGALIVIAGTALVTGFSWTALRRSAAPLRDRA
jgi:drug/metabolite transporter (DMT)-like permease